MGILIKGEYGIQLKERNSAWLWHSIKSPCHCVSLTDSTPRQNQYPSDGRIQKQFVFMVKIHDILSDVSNLVPIQPQGHQSGKISNLLPVILCSQLY